MRNRNSCLEVTLIRVPNPGAVCVKLLHHRHCDKREGRVHVGVLCIHQDPDFAYTCLKNI